MNEKKRVSIIAAALTILCIVNFISCAKPKKKAVFILCDVASRLSDTERKRVGELAGGILDKLNNDEYIVSAIHKRTDSPSDVLSSNLLLSKELRDSELQERLSSMTTDAEKMQANERTTIFEAMISTAERLRQFPSNDFEPHLVIISDMFEQSDKNPLGQSINLRTREAVSEQTKLTEKFPCPSNLKDMKVTIISPSTAEAPANNRIRLDDLKPFWNALFKHCGFTDDAIGKMWYQNEIPGYFSKPQ
jgi:hypothetical protein